MTYCLLLRLKLRQISDQFGVQKNKKINDVRPQCIKKSGETERSDQHELNELNKHGADRAERHLSDCM